MTAFSPAGNTFQSGPPDGACSASPPAQPEKRGWGLFGRKPKEEPRIEPAASSRSQRAMSQVMSRAPSDPPQAAGAKPDDLFPEHKRDEQFEIPAFLRRQQN